MNVPFVLTSNCVDQKNLRELLFNLIFFHSCQTKAARCNYCALLWCDKERKEAVQSVETSPPVICASYR